MNEFELSIGASVYGQGEKCGRLAKLVVDPETTTLTHIIVEDGLLKKNAHIVPFDAIETAINERVDLKLGRGEVANSSQYRQVNVAHTVQTQQGPGPLPMGSDSFSGHSTIPTGATRVREKVHEGISPRLRVLERNTPVVSVDGTIGPLEHLLVSADTGEITRVVARHGTLRLTHPAIAADRIQSFDDERIFVNLLNEDLDSVPDYKEMPDVAREVVTESEMEPPLVERAPEREETATSLSRRIETVLAQDPRTKNAVIDVIDEGGLITLAGEVNSAETRAVVADLVSKQPGVVSVVNNLRVR